MDSTQQQEVGPAAMPPADLWECLDGLANVVAKGLAELVAPHNLIPLEYTLLNAFLRKEAWPTMELAKRLAVKMPRTSRVVTKLVEMGLMHRRRPRNDRRVVFLTLTDEGKSLTLDLCRSVRSYEAMLLDGFSEGEMAAFAAVTSKLMVNHTALEESWPR